MGGGGWSDWGNWANCCVPSGPYLTFYIRHYRCGQSSCQGGTGSWNLNAVCLQNAVMRYARAGKSSQFSNALSCCYWREDYRCPEHCYFEENYNKDIYIVAITNGDLVFGHAVCAEYLGGGVGEFSNWKFFQYDNLNITPGDWQMPYGTEWQETKVEIKKVTDIPDCGHYNSDRYPVVTFLIDENGRITIG
ncbi:hypothetical protein RJ40_12645 [Methanofollis aquaemaris]|uniref:Uncharacterized protein n=1 Tax=Methanofollis aquaemaris TaxID=126734 RepID=A0A8A3S8C0_9EURY|nr:hypothetical protein [Methanofollis aquaemaris]QSZ68282.1 hypothetical protein RJ40_12645 [Methanofollis aquaemaris]